MKRRLRISVLLALVASCGAVVGVRLADADEPVSVVSTSASAEEEPPSADLPEVDQEARVMLTPDLPPFESWDDVPSGGVGCLGSPEVNCQELYLEKMPPTIQAWGPDGEIHEVPTGDVVFGSTEGDVLYGVREDGSWGPKAETECVVDDEGVEVCASVEP